MDDVVVLVRKDVYIQRPKKDLAKYEKEGWKEFKADDQKKSSLFKKGKK